MNSELKWNILLEATQWILNLSIPKFFAPCELDSAIQESYDQAGQAGSPW